MRPRCPAPFNVVNCLLLFETDGKKELLTLYIPDLSLTVTHQSYKKYDRVSKPIKRSAT